MKFTNQSEDRQVCLKEKFAKKVGNQLEKMAVDTKLCWALIMYEPELPPELIHESAQND